MYIFCKRDVGDCFISSGKDNNYGLFQAINDFIVCLKATGYASSTLKCYSATLANLAYMLGQEDINAISIGDVERVIIQLGYQAADTYQRTDVTLNRIKSAYRSFFKWAYERGHTTENLTAGLQLAKAYSQPTIPITIDETALLLDAIRKSNSAHAMRDQALFSIYAFTGIRRSEALSLRLADYDPLTLNLRLHHTKGGKRRLQPVPTLLADLLDHYVQSLRRNERNCDHTPLFPGMHANKHLSPRQARERFEKWKGIAGIRKSLTIHSFRAGYATILYQSSGDIFLVAHALGHSDIQTTKRYVDGNMTSVREAVELVFQRRY